MAVEKFGASERFACKVLGQNRSALRKARPVVSFEEARLRAALRAVAVNTGSLTDQNGIADVRWTCVFSLGSCYQIALWMVRDGAAQDRDPNVGFAQVMLVQERGRHESELRINQPVLDTCPVRVEAVAAVHEIHAVPWMQGNG